CSTGNLGSIIFSVIHVPTIVRNGTDNSIKYQFAAGVIGSPPTVIEASFVTPESKTSVPAIKIFAVNPAATATNPAQTPMTGFRFVAAKMIPASGGTKTKAASEARLPTIPTKKIDAVTKRRGALSSKDFIAASASPTSCTSPTAIIIQST